MIHASDLINVWHCPRLGCNIHQHKKGQHEPFANLIAPFFDLAKEKVKVENIPQGRLNDPMERTVELLKQKKGGIRLRFERDGIRTKVPFLFPICEEEESTFQESKKKTSKKRKKRYEDFDYEAIYPILSANPTENLIEMMALDQWILEGMGIHVKKHKIVYLNREYVRNGDLNPDELFIEGRHLLRKSGTPYEKTIDDQIAEYLSENDLEKKIRQAKQVLNEEDAVPVRNRYCLTPRRCAYYNDCFNEDSLDDSSILFLSSASKRAQMFEEGKDTLAKADPYQIEGSPLQFSQVMADRNGGVFLDARAAENWIASLAWPRIYLDFEWDTFAFPPYDRMIPYDVLCFEFSMHVENEDGTIRHTGFFKQGDGRKEFIETLLKNIPEHGSVIVYNMEGAEKLRLIQLARQFPEYEEQLNEICSRMVDLSVLFEKGIYYDIRQRGHYSLKTMMNLFSDQDGYSKLPVKNGLDAIEAYRRLCASHDEAERNSLAKRIDTYCAMDTEAEMIILHGLQDKLADLKNTKPAKKKKAKEQALKQTESTKIHRRKRKSKKRVKPASPKDNDQETAVLNSDPEDPSRTKPKTRNEE